MLDLSLVVKSVPKLGYELVLKVLRSDNELVLKVQ